jgi:hypothetical protein
MWTTKLPQSIEESLERCNAHTRSVSIRRLSSNSISARLLIQLGLFTTWGWLKSSARFLSSARSKVCLVAIDRFHPSSKIHNRCGGYKADLELSDRLWTCEAGGEQVDRDLNAARNIHDEALRVSASPVVAASACQLPVDAV